MGQGIRIEGFARLTVGGEDIADEKFQELLRQKKEKFKGKVDLEEDED